MKVLWVAVIIYTYEILPLASEAGTRPWINWAGNTLNDVNMLMDGKVHYRLVIVVKDIYKL